MNKDLEHLKTLSICYYVYAALSALFSLFPLIYVAMGAAFMTMDLPASGKNEPSPVLMGGIFVGIGLIGAVVGLAHAIGTFFAGKFIKQQRRYVFCLVMAGISCIFFPLGTTLGVFTFVVLARESVKALFNRGAAASSAAFGNTPPNWK